MVRIQTSAAQPGAKRQLFRLLLFAFALCGPLVAIASAQAQAPPVTADVLDNLDVLVQTPGLSGYEQPVAQKIRSRLESQAPGRPPLHVVTDNLGDVLVTIGSGAPNHLLVTPIDEPGFVVSGITADGYLRLQRLPQSGLPPIFNELYSAQPVK